MSIAKDDPQTNFEEKTIATDGANQILNKGDLQQLKKDDKIQTAAMQLQEKAQLAAKARLAAAQNAAKQVSGKILSQDDITANLLAIPNLVETKDDEYEHACVYGDAGMGKTLSICLLSEFYNIIYFDGDKGLKTAIRTLPLEMQQRIRPIRIPDNSANPVFYATILKIITGRQVTLCTDHGIVDCPICKTSNAQFVTIALNKLPSNWIGAMDSVTQFVTSACSAINKKATGKSDTVDEFKFTFDEWGVLRQITEKFGNYLKDLECNFFSVSHTLLTSTEDEKNKKLVPIGGTENASRAFAKYFSTVVNCRIVNNRHVYATSSTYNAQVTSKSRSNVKLENEKIPSLLHLLRADANVLLKGSWNEWFFSDQKGIQPKPKGIITT